MGKVNHITSNGLKKLIDSTILNNNKTIIQKINNKIHYMGKDTLGTAIITIIMNFFKIVICLIRFSWVCYKYIVQMLELELCGKNLSNLYDCCVNHLLCIPTMRDVFKIYKIKFFDNFYNTINQIHRGWIHDSGCVWIYTGKGAIKIYDVYRIQFVI